jgi:hypothetical protein
MTEIYYTNICDHIDLHGNQCSKHLRGNNCPVKLQPILNLFLCYEHECDMIKYFIELHLKNLETENNIYNILTNEFQSKIYDFETIYNMYMQHFPNTLSREQCLFPYTIEFDSVQFYRDIINYRITVICYSDFVSDNMLSYCFNFQGKMNINYNNSVSFETQIIDTSEIFDRTQQIGNVILNTNLYDINEVNSDDEVDDIFQEQLGITGVAPPIEHLVEQLNISTNIISEFNLPSNYNQSYHNNFPLTQLNNITRNHFKNIIVISNCNICYETNQLGFEFNCCSNKYICLDCLSTWILSNYNSYYELFEIHKNTNHLMKKIDCPFCRKKVYLDNIYSNKVEYKQFINSFTNQLEKSLLNEIILIKNKFKEQIH